MNTPYVAGLFDGEGTVVITKPSKTDPKKHQLRVAVCMTDERTVRMLHNHLGYGHVKVVDSAKYNPNARVRYDWVAVGSSAVRFLQAHREFMITKAAAVDIALAFSKTIGTRGKPLTAEILSQRENFRITLKEVNRRGI